VHCDKLHYLKKSFNIFSDIDRQLVIVLWGSTLTKCFVLRNINVFISVYHVIRNNTNKIQGCLSVELHILQNVYN